MKCLLSKCCRVQYCYRMGQIPHYALQGTIPSANGGNNPTDGGNGGNGSAGLSMSLYEDPMGTSVSLLNTYSLQQPFVFVNYSGCTDSPAEFSTTSLGSTEWFFGTGSYPPSSTANPAIMSYGSQGLKTFTLVSNGIPYTYTEFIDIDADGAGLNPSIISTFRFIIHQ